MIGALNVWGHIGIPNRQNLTKAVSILLIILLAPNCLMDMVVPLFILEVFVMSHQGVEVLFGFSTKL